MTKKVTLQTDIIEFDLDGTLVETTLAVEHIWTDMCKEHNVDPSDLFQHTHGVRTSDTLARYFPAIDNTDNKAALAFDTSIVTKYGQYVKIIPGAPELLKALKAGRWCIVTSGNEELATGWFKPGQIFHDIPKPEVFICAHMVSQGKPHPEGFETGAKLMAKNLGLDANTITRQVYEDSIAGVKAGVASGATVIGIASCFKPEDLYKAGASYVIQDMNSVKVLDGEKIELELDVIERE
ncbi:hypothetical protein WICPIJ_009756 [Wickerhamomyces pijperi]|uniref:Uncharacterized protein n=1 Tax=Wickerhamomyces pijperi TaxID=599730 RepID=A0A9P8PL98_WICPI|nr:hypothetical protein WICPIJ_009756 [Wickerhamomyces pijperi]